jgi:hypothetical protein
MDGQDKDSLFELCKEVYKRTKWNDNSLKHEIYEDYRPDLDISVPIYTSDYLLEKLNGFGFMDGPSEGINLKPHNNHGWGWLAYIPGYAYRYGGDENVGFADTPLKAILKLVLALDKEGIKL